MPFLLSWKQKFRLLLIIILVGLALMTASSLWTNQRLTQTLQARQLATSYAGVATNLLNQWLKLEALRRQLNPNSEARVREQMQSVRTLNAQLVAQAMPLGDPDILQRAKRLQALLDENLTSQELWLEQRRQLGLSDSEGLRRTALEAAKPLAAITITLIQPFIAEALTSQRDYLAELDPRYAEQTRSALAKLDKQLIELDWKDSKIGESASAFATSFDQVDALIRQIVASRQTLATQGQQIEEQVEQQAIALRDGLLARAEARAAQASQLSYWILGMAFCAIALMLLVSLTQASRALLTQLDRVIQQLARVAAGDLTATLDIGDNSKDEFNRLGEGSNRMTRGIAALIGQVIEGNRELGQLQRHLNTAMQRLEENSLQVEAQTEQAASASQQISATVGEMARRASDVNDATLKANESARLGATVIVTSVESMRRLSQLIQDTHRQVNQLIHSSTQVSGILDVINALADQTNLLALNAAIEAARAGDAGRGFSVVADEVRSLAQKTVAATTDIGRIIGDLREQTQSMDELMVSGLSVSAEGERQAGQAADAMGAITLNVDQLSAQMNQVAVAIEEISSTTEEIAAKMEDIHRHTGETKDLRQTLEQHATSLSAQVSALDQSTQRFRIA
ncbi:MAG: chemotaxis protein [Pseudomonas kuykendallii]|uniref:Chemotaxis protein n=3 Tax=Pseudomonas TaxID=286 RepID=A0A2W5D5S3_9PSED|nr:methyl-accepting chemotaxis protein [Pseudomonas kuykendallii]PZP25613.1 MAG: chemotaxis protein [Pseudomonas kuykendallii]